MLRGLKRIFRKGDIEPDVLMVGSDDAPRILVFTENLNATYYISFDLPLRSPDGNGRVTCAVVAQQRLSQEGADAWVEWGRRFQPDVVFMSRVGHPSGPGVLAAFQAMGTPVVYHVDDDLLNIPESLGEEIVRRQGAASVVQDRCTMLEKCDLIYASTATLADALKARFPNQEVFFGIYAPYMGTDAVVQAAAATQRDVVIGYMGSKGHQRDLELVVPAMVRLLKERPELRVEFFGTIRVPEALLPYGRRVRSLEVTVSYRDFLNRLAALKWDIGLAPLVDSPFNRCKAPTKFIEYASCGIPVVASRVSVYEKAIPSGCGVLVEDDWYSALVDVLDRKTVRDAMTKAAALHCLTQFSPERLQQQVLAVIQRAKETRARK